MRGLDHIAAIQCNQYQLVRLPNSVAWKMVTVELKIPPTFLYEKKAGYKYIHDRL